MDDDDLVVGLDYLLVIFHFTPIMCYPMFIPTLSRESCLGEGSEQVLVSCPAFRSCIITFVAFAVAC